MIEFKNTEVVGWEAAIRGMRNPLNSWNKSDSQHCSFTGSCSENCHFYDENDVCCSCKCRYDLDYVAGKNDYALMKTLAKAGTDHRKFMRMIVVYVDITAPLYWWKEFDTYKVGTVANSCSTMHKIAEKEFTIDDFSHEHLFPSCPALDSMDFLKATIEHLNNCRQAYIDFKDKRYWWQMIQLLPSSYNQRRTIELNYEVLANIYKSRKDHKLDEWSVGFMNWIKSLPYSELITGEED